MQGADADAFQKSLVTCTICPFRRLVSIVAWNFAPGSVPAGTCTSFTLRYAGMPLTDGDPPLGIPDSDTPGQEILGAEFNGLMTFF